jgi:hypothetical protein
VKKTTAVNELLADSLKRTSDGKGLEIKENSPQVKEDLERLHQYGIEFGKGKDGKLTFTADTPENAQRVKDFIKKSTGQEIEVKVRLTGPMPHVGGGPQGWDWGPAGITPGWGGTRAATPGVGGQFDWGPAGLAPSDGEPSRPAPPPPSSHHRTPWWINPGLWWLQGHETGGVVGGSGHAPGPGDTVLGWLDPKEFVVPRGPAQRYLPLLEAIRHAPGYAGGGLVGDDGSSAPGLGSPLFGPWAPKNVREAEEWQDRQREAARTTECARDRIEDLENSIQDYSDKLHDLSTQLEDESLTDQERTKLTREYNRTQQQLNRAQRDRTEAEQDLAQDQRKEAEARRPRPAVVKAVRAARVNRSASR